jgi:hypothetical protein
LPAACGLSSLDGLRGGADIQQEAGPISDEDANTDEDVGTAAKEADTGAENDDGPVAADEGPGDVEAASETGDEVGAEEASSKDVVTRDEGTDAETGCQDASCAGRHGTPYRNMPTGLPGRLEAENYDVGGEGISYHDMTPTNLLGKYRTMPNEGVDIEDRCSGIPNTCYDVTAIDPGEWSEYTISVATTGTYSIKLGVAAAAASHMHIEVDGSDASGSIAVTSTGNLFVAQPTLSNVRLSQGQHIMRLVFDEGGFSLNWIEFALV